jgi:hypothetical protein
MLKGHCHCNAVSFTFDHHPKWLVDCNCSICHRLGAIWAHGPTSSIKISAPDNGTHTYEWGDKMLIFHSCKTCGCTTHWQNKDPSKDAPMAVNTNLCDEESLQGLQLRQFDGRDSFRFID